MKIYRIIFLIATLIIINNNIFAQKMFELRGSVLDVKTRNDLPGAIVQLLRPDSSIVSSTTAISRSYNNNQLTEKAEFHFNVPSQECSYILKCTLMGYKTIYKTINLSNIGRNEQSRTLPPILMREDNILLNEITVSASKILFYNKGDTVVYNADEFLLSEGSVLDALVHLLPGVEIKENGDIFHNGRLVEKLLLNGKDFFKNDKRIMLDNLPAYSVKSIEIYDKLGERSEFVGRQIVGDSQYAMDVKLKKEYTIGYMANVDAGMGVASNDFAGNLPYILRLFSMRFTDHSRLALLSNVNNVSDERKPGQNDSWKPENIKEGTLTRQQVGFDYNIEDRNKKWNFGGNLFISRSLLDNRQNISRTNFLPVEKTFELIGNNNNNRGVSVTTNNKFRYNWELTQLTIQHLLQYNSKNNKGNKDSQHYNDTIINRYQSSTYLSGNDLTTGLKMSALLKLKNNTQDYFEISGSALFDEHHDDILKHYKMFVGQKGLLSKQNDQYFKNHPDYSLNLNANITYNHRFTNSSVFYINYGQSYTIDNHTSDLYLLDSLSNYDQDDRLVLPSVENYIIAKDLRNSYLSKKRTNDYSLCPGIQFSKEISGGRIIGQFELNITMQHNRLNYVRNVVDTTLTHKNILLNIKNSNIRWMTKDGSKQVMLKYQLNTKTPDLLNMVDICDDSDPLNLHVGNRNLKPSKTHYINMTYSHRVSKAVKYSVIADGTVVSDAIGMAYSLNDKTGARTYFAKNVNGNWQSNLRGNVTYSKNALITNFIFGASHIQNADFVGVGNDIDVTRNIVSTNSINATISPSVRIKKHQLGIKLDGIYKHINNLNGSAASFDTWNFNSGVTALIQPFSQFQIASDFTLYCRRGWQTQSLNTNELVLNARMVYTTKNGKMSFILDGYDILGQLSNITCSINGQGREEIRRNVLSQYGIFHFQYRLNHTPKKMHK